MLTTQINGKTFEIDGNGFLSPTEELTLEDWLHDMRVQDAARKRCRSPETVSSHRKSLREKTHQHSGTGVLAHCLSMGYIRVLVFAGFAVGAEPVLQSNQSFQVVRTAARYSRGNRYQIFGAAGGIH